MLLQLAHETHYRYEPGVQSAEHVLCLSLRDTPCQEVITQSLELLPEQCQKKSQMDEWGNCRLYLSIDHWHSEFCARLVSTVRTMRVEAPLPNVSCAQAWQRLRGSGQYWATWLTPTGQTQYDGALSAYAASCFQPDTGLLESCVRLMQRIQQDFLYQPNSTTIDTPAIQVFAQRSGVCQDFAHLMLAALRSQGFVARYVSGYLLTTPPPGQDKLVGVDASHAWVSVFVPTSAKGRSGYWYDFCPTNGRWGFSSPGEDFITLSYGRDYHDVSPIRGMLTGEGSQTMQVSVNVQALNG